MTNLKTYFKELFEAETFKARSKESGKVVQFKSKDAYNAAVKAGTHEDPKAPKSGKAGGKDSKKDVPKANIFDKPTSTDKGGPKSYGMKKKSFFGNDTEDGRDPKSTSPKYTKVKPDSPEIQTIAKYAGVREKFLADFINQHKLDVVAVADFVKNGSLKDRKDFFTAAVGNPGNEYEKKIIDKFGDKSDSDDKGGPKSYGMKKKSFFGNDTEDGPDPVDTSPKPDTQGDKFELGTPAVYTDNGKEYSGEVVMNPSNQRVQINGQWTTIGKGTVKGIQTYGSDTFIVPDDWNDAKGFDDSMEEPTPAQQRKGNPQVNKAAKSAAEEAGITPQKLGGEYKDTMYKAAIEALTDSNYHDEARALVAAIEGKPEWAKKPEYPSMDDPKYNEKMKALRTTGVDSSEYWDYDDKTGRFARKASSEAGWDGAAAVDGIAFTLRMNGFHKEADMIQSVLNESVTRLTGILKETTYFKKQSKSKSLNEAFNAKDLPPWLFDDPVDFEDWYEDGMKLAKGKGKLAPFSSSDEKKLFQLVGVWQDSEGDYQYGRGDYGTGKTTGARSASYTAQDDIKKFLTQKGKIVDESLNEASEPEVISQLKDIVKNQQYQTIKDPKSGKKMKVDMQTANAVLQIYNGLSNVNKDNMVKMGLPKMIEVSYKIISKYR